MDWNLTTLGSIGALLIYTSRVVTQTFIETRLVDAKNVLTCVILALFVNVVCAKTQFECTLKPLANQPDASLLVFNSVFLCTCICYGALASLIPLTCYQIFGPSAT